MTKNANLNFSTRPVAVAPPPYYSDGVMNKGLENNINMQEDLAKHGIYTTGLPNSHITNNVHNGKSFCLLNLPPHTFTPL